MICNNLKRVLFYMTKEVGKDTFIFIIIFYYSELLPKTVFLKNFLRDYLTCYQYFPRDLLSWLHFIIHSVY